MTDMLVRQHLECHRKLQHYQLVVIWKCSAVQCIATKQCRKEKQISYFSIDKEGSNAHQFNEFFLSNYFGIHFISSILITSHVARRTSHKYPASGFRFYSHQALMSFHFPLDLNRKPIIMISFGSKIKLLMLIQQKE